MLEDLAVVRRPEPEPASPSRTLHDERQQQEPLPLLPFWLRPLEFLAAMAPSEPRLALWPTVQRRHLGCPQMESAIGLGTQFVAGPPHFVYQCVELRELEVAIAMVVAGMAGADQPEAVLAIVLPMLLFEPAQSGRVAPGGQNVARLEAGQIPARVLAGPQPRIAQLRSGVAGIAANDHLAHWIVSRAPVAEHRGVPVPVRVEHGRRASVALVSHVNLVLAAGWQMAAPVHRID